MSAVCPQQQFSHFATLALTPQAAADREADARARLAAAQEREADARAAATQREADARAAATQREADARVALLTTLRQSEEASMACEWVLWCVFLACEWVLWCVFLARWGGVQKKRAHSGKVHFTQKMTQACLEYSKTGSEWQRVQIFEC